MASRSWYQGDGIGLVDDKGRVAIPAALRASLQANSPKADGKSGGTVIVGPHQKNRCLIAYDPAWLDIMVAKLEKRETENTGDGGEPDYNIKRAAGLGESVPFDGSGRFIMPAWPRHYAAIGAQALFVGVLDYIEIWDPQALIDSDYPPQAKQMAEFYLNRGAK
ncbi:division/cell wall cluster transcriptional repressor MraZ [Sphingomonas bacterium]|uniref:division/cell wall cluster transcriptional repressor MraZ n=1 Tax=Sphingomonas bacterium TaxID=1895847 RepID=UPI00157715B7|nr:division/cell wall cluster transcriptional repressor MraZ [Sphingomonas bacterium]